MQKGHNMVTIDDIAREAGVSHTTVSNVIRGNKNRVSEKTKENIMRIIEEKGYVPNMSARALAEGSSKVVAMINHLDPKKSGYFMEDPFHNTFIGAAEHVMRTGGYYLMIRTISNATDLREFLANWNVDGFFMAGLFEDTDLYPVLLSSGKPVVLIDSYLADYGDMINVGLEDFEGSYIATQHLIANNHRRIAFAGPPIKPRGVVEQRLQGYKKALQDAGLEFDEELVFEREFSTSVAMKLGDQLASRQDITALFATADILAAGIMSGLQQAGRMVPQDFSIVGFDDINFCRMTYPQLTTVHQDADRKGKLAAAYMMDLLEGQQLDDRQVILPVRLVRRGSVRSLGKD